MQYRHPGISVYLLHPSESRRIRGSKGSVDPGFGGANVGTAIYTGPQTDTMSDKSNISISPTKLYSVNIILRCHNNTFKHRITDGFHLFELLFLAPQSRIRTLFLEDKKWNIIYHLFSSLKINFYIVDRTMARPNSHSTFEFKKKIQYRVFPYYLLLHGFM